MITHKIKRQANQIIMPSHTHTQGHRQWWAHVKKKKKTTKNTLFPPSPTRPHLYKCGKTKRSHESVTAFQRALVLIVSLKQLFSSHSVPTSHSQLLAACTHMYIRPHGHFICRGNILSVWLLLLNASFSLPPPLFNASQTLRECDSEETRDNAAQDSASSASSRNAQLVGYRALPTGVRKRSKRVKSRPYHLMQHKVFRNARESSKESEGWGCTDALETRVLHPDCKTLQKNIPLRFFFAYK